MLSLSLSKIAVTSSLLLFSMFHRFCVDRSWDSVPLWGTLGNKSNSCLHVEAHGKVLAHFSSRQIYPQIGRKWAKKK